MNRRPTALALALALTVLSLGPLAPPVTAASAPARAAAAASPASSGGVYAAIGCGLGVKALLLGGFANPVVWVLTLIPCALMIQDALSTPD